MTNECSRQAAREAGLSRYCTGQPCAKGHVSERYVSNNQCVECQSSYTSSWYARNREKVLASVRAWGIANAERKEKSERAWRTLNGDRKLATDAAWRSANKERERAATKAWLKANPQAKGCYLRTRRARKLAGGGRHTSAEIAWLFEKQRGRCAHSWCQQKLRSGYEVDHILPLVLRGSNDRRNLQLLCVPCNRSKHTKHPIAFAQQNGMLL